MTDQSAQTDPWRAHYAHACDWALDLPPLALPDMFAAAAAAHGNKPLVDFLGREFSYAALYAEARAFAAGLDRKSTRLNSSHPRLSRMPSSA